MPNLTRGHEELFRRTPDERFTTFEELLEHCGREQHVSTEQWQLPQTLAPQASGESVVLQVDSRASHLNDWSFSQLCRMSGISKDTLVRLSSETASRALQETLPSAEKPVQVLTAGSTVRSLHGVAYTRLWNYDLLNVVQRYASDFQPPPVAFNGATGLYCGEQDLFAFLIDPTGWTEIDGENFAPGFFVWNSEVGRRTLGIQTFWFQEVCQNHIVWDATQVIEFTRKHTASVHDGLAEIGRLIEQLVQQRNERRDGFVRVIRKAMSETLGVDADQATKSLLEQGIPRHLVREAVQTVSQRGRFSIFSFVDVLTRLTGKIGFAGDRTEADARVAKLLMLAA